MKLLCGDGLAHIQQLLSDKVVVVTDPPFNIGYHYTKYKDKLPEEDYYEMLVKIVSSAPSIIVHYPEALYKLAIKLGKAPERVISWVYNSNTAKQHRDIAFFGIRPDMGKVRQPYKNPNDKRIKERMKNGAGGGRLYDWWNVNQVKNVNKEKTAHPCQMPIDVMEKVIGILPDDAVIVDPFMGSGTTGIAVLSMNRKQKVRRDFIGIELDETYYNIAKERINDFKEAMGNAG